VKTMAEVLEEVWDDGNCTGLDGWIGPGRGSAEVDAEALHARERVIQKATAMLTAAGFGPVKAAAAGALRNAAEYIEASIKAGADDDVSADATRVWLRARAATIEATQ
jgi:hypothetical protein